VESRASLKHARISARKVKIVIDLIRGKDVQEALAILKFTPKAASPLVEKLVKSAIANAENNHNMDVDRLVVREAYVGKAMVMKRFQAGAKGRANRIIKPFSNMTVVVAEQEVAPKTTAKTKKLQRRRMNNGSESKSDRPALRN
jgi:large subunit ribosomal protein L22